MPLQERERLADHDCAFYSLSLTMTQVFSAHIELSRSIHKAHPTQRGLRSTLCVGKEETGYGQTLGISCIISIWQVLIEYLLHTRSWGMKMVQKKNVDLDFNKKDKRKERCVHITTRVADCIFQRGSQWFHLLLFTPLCTFLLHCPRVDLCDQ